MINTKSIFYIVLIIYLSQCVLGFRNLPKTFQSPPKAADYYREQNICPYLKIPVGGGNFMSVWSCNVPYEIPYCGTTATIDYACCPGKRKDSKYTPEQCIMTESVWKVIPDYLAYYEKATAASLAKAIAPLSDGKNTYTLFVPYNDADLPKDTAKAASALGLTPGRRYSVDWKNGLKLPGIANNGDLKVTIYSNNLMFVECRMLVKPDLEAKNGLIHVVSGPINSGAATVYDAIANNAATSDFAKEMPADIKKMLTDVSTSTWYTVFAPTNAAWKAAKGKYDKVKLYKNAIINRMICSQAITGSSSKVGPTILGEYIGAECQASTERVIKDGCGKAIKVSGADMMGQNGVVHQIDEALVPIQARPLADALTCMSAGNPQMSLKTSIAHWAECGISLDNKQQYLLLMPTDAAHAWFKAYKPLAAQYKRFTTDKVYRCNTYRYHVLLLQKSGLPASWYNQIAFPTLYKIGNQVVTNSNYYVKYRWGSELSFEYGNSYNLTAFNLINGYLYLLKRVIVIPEFTRVQMMDKRPNDDLRLIYKMIIDTGYDKVLIKEGPNSLFLAPRSRFLKNHVIMSMTNAAKLEFLRLHTIRLRGWGDDIGYWARQTFQYAETILQVDSQYFIIALKRYISGNMYIGNPITNAANWSMVLEWNIQGWDGIVWVIDWPIICPPQYCIKKEDKKKEIELMSFVVYASTCNTMEGVVGNIGEFQKNHFEIAPKFPKKCIQLKTKARKAVVKWELD